MHTTAIVTALFDINREKLGDGRAIEQYLSWFENTLKLKSNFIVYTEKRFKEFVTNCRKNSEYDTHIIEQNLNEIPYSKYRDSIHSIISSNEYRRKMRDVNRIECNLPEYNVIQYSKFGWLEASVNKFDYDYYFWMDAGCSRFFEDFDINNEWPNKIPPLDKLTIQGNINYQRNFTNMIPNEYIWDNNSMLVGTLFGIGKDLVKTLESKINDIFLRYFGEGCVNNEQFALAILAKENPSIMNIITRLDGTHLPLFKLL